MRSGSLAPLVLLVMPLAVLGESGSSRSSVLVLAGSSPWGGSLKYSQFIVITWIPDSFIVVIFPEWLSFPSKKRLKGFPEVCSWHGWCVCVYNLHMPCSLLWLCVGNTACWHCARYYYYYMFFLLPISQAEAEREHKACRYSKGAEAWPGCKLFTFSLLLLLPVMYRQAWSRRALLAVVGLCWSLSVVVCGPAGMASSVTNARSDVDGCLLTNMLWNANYLSHCWTGDGRQMVLMSLCYLKTPHLVLRRQSFFLPPIFMDILID